MVYTDEVVAVAGLLFGGGSVVGLISHIIRHAKKHQQIEDHLAKSIADFATNTEDHRRIDKKLDELGIGVRELLVHEGLRVPGQGLNGNDADG